MLNFATKEEGHHRQCSISGERGETDIQRAVCPGTLFSLIANNIYIYIYSLACLASKSANQDGEAKRYSYACIQEACRDVAETGLPVPLHRQPLLPRSGGIGTAHGRTDAKGGCSIPFGPQPQRRDRVLDD